MLIETQIEINGIEYLCEAYITSKRCTETGYYDYDVEQLTVSLIAQEDGRVLGQLTNIDRSLAKEIVETLVDNYSNVHADVKDYSDYEYDLHKDGY